MDTLIQVAAGWILPALFFWFLFSLTAMSLIEIFQRIRKYRQRGLHEVIGKLLGEKLADEFLKHPLVNPLQDAAYISSALFAQVLMEWLLKRAPGARPFKQADIKAVHAGILDNLKALGQKNPKLGDALEAIVVQAHLETEDVPAYLELIQKDLEAWFIEAVSQMSFVYGTRLWGITLLVSLVLAFLGNFDVINMTVRLWGTSKDSELLPLLAKTGQSLQIDTNLYRMLPVGWYAGYLPSTLLEWLLKIVGLYLGAFFIAVGSQYTFNLWKGQYRPSK